MKFKNWVADQGGPKMLGRKLRVNQFTIYNWFRKEGSVPRPRLMRKLVALGKGAFDLTDILNETGGRK